MAKQKGLWVDVFFFEGTPEDVVDVSDLNGELYTADECNEVMAALDKMRNTSSSPVVQQFAAEMRVKIEAGLELL